MKAEEHLTGLIAAPHTPFDRNGEVAWEVIPQQAELLIQGSPVPISAEVQARVFPVQSVSDCGSWRHGTMHRKGG